MDIIPLTMGFPYRTTFIPYRGRKPRSHWFRGEAAAGIRSVGSDETQAAYRLHRPYLDRRPLLGRSQRVPHTLELVREASDETIVRYDGTLWRPLCDCPTQLFEEQENLDEFHRSIAEGWELRGGRYDNLVSGTEVLSIARRQIVNHHDRALTSASPTAP